MTITRAPSHNRSSSPFLSALYARTERPPGGSRKGKVKNSSATEDTSRKGIRCADCKTLVTTKDQKTKVADKHNHTFFNPAGILFEIGCFSKAEGTAVQGGKSSEFSWFAGYYWQIALCGVCGIHLGWKFEGKQDAFYGLIKNRLIEGYLE